MSQSATNPQNNETTEAPVSKHLKRDYLKDVTGTAAIIGLVVYGFFQRIAGK